VIPDDYVMVCRQQVRQRVGKNIRVVVAEKHAEEAVARHLFAPVTVCSPPWLTMRESPYLVAVVPDRVARYGGSCPDEMRRTPL